MEKKIIKGAQGASETNRNPFTNLEAFKVGQDFNEIETAIDYSVIPLRKRASNNGSVSTPSLRWITSAFWKSSRMKEHRRTSC